MAYLLLNFAGNSDSGSSRHQDFYNKPLKEQYEALSARYPQLKRFQYEQFIQACFSVGEQRDYYISMPNFIRGGNDAAESFFNNIVVRATANPASRHFLPTGLEIILIGDVSMKFGELTVKGIEFIEDSIYKHGEMKINATAACAFANKSFILNGKTVTVPEYGFNLNQNPSVITRDLMLEMCTRNFTVSNPMKVVETFLKWSDYVDFRRYYLTAQGESGIAFDECEAIKCCVISRRDYQSNPERYDGHILDNLDGARKDEQVIVTKQFDNGEPFSLVRVIINKNKKELFDDTVKGKGETPMFEQKLKRFTRADVALESEDGKRRVFVDERYRLFNADIEPNYSDVETQFAKKLETAYAEIDGRYSAALKTQVTQYLVVRTEALSAEDANVLSKYIKGLSDSLEQDVAVNSDTDIAREYAAQVKAKEDIVREQTKKMEKSYADKIAIVRKSKDKDSTNKMRVLLSQLKEEKAIFAEDLARQKNTVSLQVLYDTRNKKLIAIKEATLKSEREATLRRNQAVKQREIFSAQEPQIQDEKQNKKRENTGELASKKAEMKKNMTTRRYYIYFKLQANDTPDRVNNEIAKVAPKFFKLDQRAEKAKIDRQEKSLKNFFGGYVKNPFLSTYLFAPQELGESVTELPDIEYFSPRLNEKQKEAVRKAIASESIFLLQGPPGTGKTEVIAEIAAQFVKRGKRILISSETHKAIDNVFERLPKIPEIRPLRLIPSQSKKEANQYSPERLVDNFYINISDRLDKEVERYNNFSNYKEKFGEEYALLQIELEKLNKERSRIQGVQIALDKINRDRDSITQKCDAASEKLRAISDESEALSRTLRNAEAMNLGADDERIKRARESLLTILIKYPTLKQDVETLSFIYRVDIAKIKEEIAALSDNSELVNLEAKRAIIKVQMDNLRDTETDDVIVGKEDEYSRSRERFIELGKKITMMKSSVSIDLAELSISKIVNKAELAQGALSLLANVLLEIKGVLVETVTSLRTLIGADYDVKVCEYNMQKDVVDDLKNQIRGKDIEAQIEKENNGYEDYRATESGLKRKITEFFSQFNIVAAYEDIPSALEIIKTAWNDLERNYTARESENREKIPMYSRILNFLRELQSDGSIETDRMAYTKKLFENANIFGLTCTSRENFKAESMDSFKKYALDDLDVKKQGIDVVIIDEVSKSSFLDLLIPILYGKTVILVGDHRQLPPMYDLRNMREDDFDGLDSNIIDKRKNDEYASLYEECFFKTLFESVPDQLRVTLTKQYRCHEDIMKVFNHFYGNSSGRGSLELGAPNQNDQKQHGLLIKGKGGRPIIESDKHIYFVDCGDSYEKFGDSTSATNETEARVVVELAKKIDEAYGRVGGFEVNKSRGKDTRRSMGVICTYGDQAKLIKRKLNKNALKNICELSDERFIVSTVDDFQGDERDIIFVSMVRNPEPKNRARTRAEFVKKFERINVALSRARRLLIIVGSKDFLSEATINLPDMSGNHALDQPSCAIYRNIIGTIATNGLLLKASDVLGEDL